MKNRITEDISNGIELTKRTRITLTNRILISPKLKMLQLMLVTAGVYGTLSSLISGLNIPVYKSVLNIAILTFVIGFTVLYQFRSALKYSLPVCLLLYLMAGYVFLDEIKNGFWNLENIYIEYYNNYFDTNILKYLVDDYDKSLVITILFIFIAILLSFVLNSVVLQNSKRFLFGITTVPIVALPFTVGKIPSSLPLGIYLISVISIMGMGTTREGHRRIGLKKHERQKAEDHLLEQNFRYVIGLKVAGHLGGLLLLLILISSFIITPDLFHSKFKVDDTRRKIQKAMMEFDLEDVIQNITSIQINGPKLFRTNTATGGLSGGKLGRIGEVKFNYEKALRIQMVDTGNNVYLKGYVGSDYKGDHWDGLSEEDINTYNKFAALWEYEDFTVANMSSHFLSLLRSSSFINSYYDIDYFTSDMEVEGIGENLNYFYAPYYTDYELNGVAIVNMEYVIPARKQKSYQLMFYNCLSDMLEFDEEDEYRNFLSKITDYNVDGQSTTSDLAKLNRFRDYEKEYRNFVYDVYTRLPEEGLEQVRHDFGSISYKEYKKDHGGKSLPILVNLVKRRLSEMTTYSLAPGNLPKGKDFVEYFLYENKTGYCAHFASAATMIFRAMGVPARYVEGYIIRQADIADGEVVGTRIVSERMDGSLGNYQMVEKSVEITDANAHAWVEIYVDGFGWVPVEVTSGYSGYAEGREITDVWSNQVGRLNQLIPGTTPIPNPAKDEKANEEKDKVTDSKEKENTEEDEKKKNKDGKSSNNTQEGTGKNKVNLTSSLIKIGYVILWGVILLSGAILILALRAFIILSKRRKTQKNVDFSKRVLHRYKEIKRIFNYYNIREEEDLTYKEAAVKIEEQWKVLQPGSYVRFMDIVLKARFHQYSITKTEAKEAEEFYRKLIDSIYTNKNFFQRFVLRIVKVIG